MLAEQEGCYIMYLHKLAWPFILVLNDLIASSGSCHMLCRAARVTMVFSLHTASIFLLIALLSLVCWWGCHQLHTWGPSRVLNCITLAIGSLYLHPLVWCPYSTHLNRLQNMPILRLTQPVRQSVVWASLACSHGCSAVVDSHMWAGVNVVEGSNNGVIFGCCHIEFATWYWELHFGHFVSSESGLARGNMVALLQL